MISQQLQHKIDHKTKPLGALGDLEKIALQIGKIQQTASPSLTKPTIVVFAADHGIAKEGVSAYPQEVTFQMVMNFLQGGAAINVFCKQNGLEIKIVDAGVNFDFAAHKDLIIAKIAKGTQSFLRKAAMNTEELRQCFEYSEKIIDDIYTDGCNVIGFGEMGIGNTSSASILMSLLSEIPLEECVGRGTGLDNIQLSKKMTILAQSIENHHINHEPLEVLSTFGGFEIAQMCGAMLAAYQKNMLILVDGFIASAAFLVAYKINPNIKSNAIFCHLSNESGHVKLLKYLGVEPLLKLNMRLGEGTGCAIAYPIIESAVNFLNQMASFETAKVANKEIVEEIVAI